MTTQEKLEAFAPYLPYGLKFYHKRMDGEPTSLYTLVAIQFIGDDLDLQFGDGVDPENVIWASDLVHKLQIYGFESWVKPIFRPLSDLTKPCLEGGNVPIVELAKECFKACYGFDFKNDKFDVHCNTSSSNYSTIFRDEKDYVFAINNRDWRFNVEFKTRNMVFDLNVNKIIQQLYKWHFWLGDQSEFGKSIIDINNIKTE